MAQKHREEKTFRGLIIITLAVILILCFALRVILPWSLVFTDDGIRLMEVDPYYQMRDVDWLVHNNMAKTPQYDPYALYPTQAGMRTTDLFNRFIAGIVIIVGMGNPSDNLIDSVAIFIPPILAVLTTLIIYFIGKVLFSPILGLVSAGLYAIIPGESMGRALLGMVDQHIFEVFLSCLVILFFILAVKNRDRFRQSILWSVATGITLWLYCWAWSGAYLFGLVICLYIAVQSIISHIKNQQYRGVLIIGGITIGIPTILLALKIGFITDATTMSLMPLSLFVLLFFSVLSFLPRKLNIIYYFLILISPFILLFGIHWAVYLFIQEFTQFQTGILGSLNGFTQRIIILFMQTLMLSHIFGHNVVTSTAEEMPLLYWRGSFSMSVAWGNFGFCFLFILVGLWFTFSNAIKNNKREILILAVWSAVIFALSLAMRRFAYYLAVNIAILSAYVLYLIWKLIPKDIWKRVSFALLIIVAMVLPLVPSIKDMGEMQPSIQTEGWQEALAWLRDNTSEPFGSSHYYYSDYDTVGVLPPIYTVLSWWDYGYWITREGRRVPICNPGGGSRYLAAQFFLSLDAKEAYDYLKEVNTRYIVIDYSTAIDKFYALPAQTRTGAKIDSFFGVFNVLQKNNTMTVNPFFYPAYYQSMIARLYNFGGQKVESPGTIAIQYDKNSRVTSLNDFATLKEAEDYVQTHEGSFAVGGTDPFISPINLEPLDSYKLVFESKQRIGGQAEVKIFEVLN